MERLAIIADDLTGAADAGVRFARQGLTTIVTWGAEALAPSLSHPRPLPDADVIVFNTDSRALTAEEAYACAKAAALRLKASGYRQVYKKIDSTLRGQWGAEVDAVMDVFDCELAVVAPAFPRLGRTTAAGVHYLHGVPVAETEIARDPKCPVGDSNLVRLLSAQTQRSVGLVHRDPASGTESPAGATAINEQVERLTSRGVRLLVCDAQTEDDLARIAGAFAGRSYAALWVGSAGLAEYWPAPTVAAPDEGAAGSFPCQAEPDGSAVPVDRRDAITLTGAPSAQSASHIAPGERAASPSSPFTPAADLRPVPSIGDAVMLVAGSMSGVSFGQIARMKLEPNVIGVDFDPSAVARGSDTAAIEIDRCRGEIGRAIALGLDVAFHVAVTPASVAASRAAAVARDVSPMELAAAISNALGEVAAAIVGGHRIAGLILTGGDTAIAVCRALSADGLRLVAELEPGIPLGAIAGGDADGLPVVTKAGAFGSADTFVHALDALKGRRGIESPRRPNIIVRHDED
ncbi:hypothetical protein FE784_23755 [Paenibacillus hemerocallicola]|uniref:Four-carbon acid sugar kinase family protein n=1 Tax=Paenibacillus hemerocallicola TaxID=1172614 RepID=A0A5C4T4W0_9BACL|nr:hypothetical protein FE784_23755 [Paenibacillus hemerocallicola]